MEQTEVVEQFKERFFAINGSTAELKKEQPLVGKRKFEYKRIFRELTHQNYSNHLKTEVGLVPIPIIDNDKCFWGAIDIDIYDLTLEQQMEIINAATEYKLVAAWSESKGLHLYCQSSKRIFAKGMRNYLLSVAAKLPHLKTIPEVFPKQTKLGLDKDGKKQIGNGIKLPYRNYFNSNSITSTGIIVRDNRIIQIKPEIFLKRLEENELEEDVFKRFYADDLVNPTEEIPDNFDLGSMNDPEIKKLSSKEILAKIKKEKMSLDDESSYFDDLVTLAIGKMVASRIKSDQAIMESCLKLDLEKTGTTPDYFRSKLDRARVKLGIDDPEIAKEKIVKNVIYLKETDRFYDLQTKNDYPKAAINHTYGIYFGKNDSAATYLQKHPHGLVVENWLYDPKQYDKNKPIIEVNKNKYLNSYQPHDLVAEKGDVSLLYELLNHVFNNDKDYINHFLDYVSYPLKNPGAKIRHALIIVSTSYQFGKGTLWRMIGEIYGANSLAIDVLQALDKSKGYTQKAQMVLIDEMQSVGDFSEGRSLLNDLKRIITEKEVSSRELYKDYRIVKTCANYILFSNNKNALALKPNEVRYWVYITERPRANQEFYTKIHKWLDDGGAAAILYELLNREISPKFDPNAIAPKTPFLGQMSTAGEHPLTALIRKRFEEKQTPFITSSGKEIDVIGSTELFEWLKNNNLLGRARINDVSNALEQIGARNLGQCRIKVRSYNPENFAHNYSNANNPDHETKVDYQIKKPTLYLLNKLDELVNLDPQQIAEEYYRPIDTNREHSGNY
jgi:hypothetical protein